MHDKNVSRRVREEVCWARLGGFSEINQGLVLLVVSLDHVLVRCCLLGEGCDGSIVDIITAATNERVKLLRQGQAFSVRLPLPPPVQCLPCLHVG